MGFVSLFYPFQLVEQQQRIVAEMETFKAFGIGFIEMILTVASFYTFSHFSITSRACDLRTCLKREGGKTKT